MYKTICFFFSIVIGYTAFAQNKFTISGYVRDAKTGEELIGAIVSIHELPSTGISTNSYGFYSITIPYGTYHVSAQFVGFENSILTIDLNQNKKADFSLNDKVTELNEVIVSAAKTNENVVKPQMGVNNLKMKEIKNIPAFMGERDVLKSIQLLPGVLPAGEGNSGFFVRGGSADQNLILLDEATVYNASHLLGFFSVFNPDAVKDVTLYKGTMPAEYGGRLSSVLAMSMNDGNDKEYHVNGGIGLISSRLTVEGPIVKDKGSFIISGRRTYADIIAKSLYHIGILSDTSLKTASLYFYDLNAKANYKISDNDRLFLSGYFGQDVMGISAGGINWGNSTATLRWNHLFTDKLFSNTSLIYSNYSYTINNSDAKNAINIVSKIQDWNLKEDFQLFHGEKSQVKFGFNVIYHNFVPGTVQDTILIKRPPLPKKYAWENAVYFTHEYKITHKISLNYGLRGSMFALMGPGTFYTYDKEGNIADSTLFGSGKVVKFYPELEPRAAADIMINDVSSMKISYTRNTQYMHLLSNENIGLPTDLWIPSSNNVKPELADQYSIGYFRNFNDNEYEFSTELYYKNMQNQIDYVPGAQLNFNANVESQLVYGIGKAYGMELFLNKKTGRLTGWISYTLSHSQRKFPDVNNDTWYNAKQDRTHDISVVGIYELSKKWTLSGTWVYYTGNAVTFPSGKYIVNNQVVSYYTSRNGYRMPPYHRLDLGATYQNEKKGRYESSWTFSIYNAYNRDNAYAITFGPSKTDPTKSVATQTTLFKFVPSVMYNFKF
jgi:hypothetical protein